MEAILDGEGFPPVDLALAYGSGAIAQAGYDQSSSAPRDQPMIDLILSVADPVAWHARNLEVNRGHYSSILAAAGPGAITSLQRATAGVYYNTLVPMKGSGQEGSRLLDALCLLSCS